ncbi:hypothetical protein LIER_15552 [Lithospermum erythrorhizon]|uniref:Uncharacterized protein n=1 Tax=Lithospermum erythrorhizon TaxID=34254 RepID=A0AAV3Q3E7_LITER
MHSCIAAREAAIVFPTEKKNDIAAVQEPLLDVGGKYMYLEALDYIDYLDRMTGKVPIRPGVSTRVQSALGGMNHPGLDIPAYTQRQSQKPLRGGDTELARATSEGPRTLPKSTQVDVNTEEGQVPRHEEPSKISHINWRRLWGPNTCIRSSERFGIVPRKATTPQPGKAQKMVAPRPRV